MWDNGTMERLVFIDIDGTILDHHHEVPPSAAEALEKTVLAGNRLIFSTGRNGPEVFPQLWDLGFTGLVGGGGTYGELDGQILFDHRLSFDAVTAASNWMAERGLSWLWQTPEYLYGSPGFWDAFASGAESVGTDSGRQKFIDSVTPALRSGIPESASKAVVIIPPGATISYPQFEERFGGDFTLIPGSMSETFGRSVELIPRGINKATGIRELLPHLGAKMEDVIGIGDSNNDIEMIAEVGFGIAMGNSVPQVIESADWVTTDVDQNGLALALEKAGVTQPS